MPWAFQCQLLVLYAHLLSMSFWMLGLPTRWSRMMGSLWSGQNRHLSTHPQILFGDHAFQLSLSVHRWKRCCLQSSKCFWLSCWKRSCPTRPSQQAARELLCPKREPHNQSCRNQSFWSSSIRLCFSQVQPFDRATEMTWKIRLLHGSKQKHLQSIFRRPDGRGCPSKPLALLSD